MNSSSLAAKLIYKNRFALKFFPHFLSNKYLRNLLFYFFNKFSFEEKENLFYHSKTFLFDNDIEIKNGYVSVVFNNAKIKIPHLTGGLSQLGRAFSLMGHDHEVKNCYQFLINKFDINVFYDVGANFGQHTILMLSQNIKCFAFEPNKICHDELIALAKDNNYEKFELTSFAVGEKHSDGYLNFSKNETWLGKISLNKSSNTKVSIISLDSFSTKNDPPQLIKIDTEGFELNVLNGSKKLINEYNPFIIFESLENKSSVYKFFLNHNYAIIDLKSYKKVDKKEFDSKKGNFLACPIVKHNF